MERCMLENEEEYEVESSLSHFINTFKLQL